MFKTLMHSFARAAGYNGKQIVEAGSRLGFTKEQTRRRMEGRSGSDHAERLAMTAALAGLDPYEMGDVGPDERCRIAFEIARDEWRRCQREARAAVTEPERLCGPA